MIELIDKIKQANNGSFSLVDAEDIEMSDGTRLDETINKLDNKVIVAIGEDNVTDDTVLVINAAENGSVVEIPEIDDTAVSATSLYSSKKVDELYSGNAKNIVILEETKANKDEIANGLTAKGACLYSSLPTTGNEVGDYWYCSDGNETDGAGNYVWNGTEWYFGGTGDEGYNKLENKINDIWYDNFNEDLKKQFKVVLQDIPYTRVSGFYTKEGVLKENSSYSTKIYKVESNARYVAMVRSKWEAIGCTLWNDEEFVGYLGESNENGTTDLQDQQLEIIASTKFNKIAITEDADASKRDNFYLKRRVIKQCTSIEKNEIRSIAGLKWVALGDSLTDAATLGTGNPNYTNYVAESLGLEMINLGKGGTGYLADNGYGQQFYTRVSDMPSDTDIITIFGSFNDDYLTYTLGEVTDTTNDTLYGAMNYLLTKIYEINPKIIVGIISPTPWGSRCYRGDRAQEAKQYVDALKNFSEYNGLPFLDLFHRSGLRPWDNTIKTLYYNNEDGVHPNSEGHLKYIYPQVTEFIRSIIMGYNVN